MERLAANKGAWAAAPVGERIAVLKEIRSRLLDEASGCSVAGCGTSLLGHAGGTVRGGCGISCWVPAKQRGSSTGQRRAQLASAELN